MSETLDEMLCRCSRGFRLLQDCHRIEALSSIIPYLPVSIDTAVGSVVWPPGIFYALKAVERGPDTSDVRTGQSLYEVIMDMRSTMPLSEKYQMYKATGEGLKIYFDAVISFEDAEKFFGTTLPSVAKLALDLPRLLLENVCSYGPLCSTYVQNLHLRVLSPQSAGAVFLSQELVASLLACAFFCLYPFEIRLRDGLPPINFDLFFGNMVEVRQSQTEKMRCIIHYFERVFENIPCGVVSYERKVLAPEKCIGLEETLPSRLCEFRVIEDGAIEDAGCIALQVDFANKFLGGGALSSGCVQEEIRFMINPELIAGMLFMTFMSNYEAIEVIGAERYSCYEGYGPSFSFADDFVDTESRDVWGRRKTRIVAIDALSRPGEDQFKTHLIHRELNKAFCGFLDHSVIPSHQEEQRYLCHKYGNAKIFEVGGSSINDAGTKCTHGIPEQFATNNIAKLEESTRDNGSNLYEKFNIPSCREDDIGIATGNWGCGAFGGDLQFKSMLQWVAASQAKRPFVLYFSFGDNQAERLQEIVHHIQKSGWCTGELLILLLRYANLRRLQRGIDGLFDWLLPKRN